MTEEELKILSRSKRGANGEVIVRTPQFPGVKPNMTIEQVRAIIRRQKRSRGFRFGVVAGGNAANVFNIPLSGTARVFLGFAVLFDEEVAASVPLDMTITINNEIVIDAVPPGFFNPAFMDDEYYFFPRPLSGQDTIVLQVNGTAALDFLVIVYYI